jgi:hypothetical protein
MLLKNIMPHEEFMALIKGLSPNSHAHNQEVPFLQRIMGTSHVHVSQQEELAYLLVSNFGKKTSVVYDMSAAFELF